MRPVVLLVLASALAACTAPESAELAESPAAQGIADHVFSDPEVTRIHSRMIGTAAPDNGWEQARYIQFDWIVAREEGPVRRSHRWDRYTGEYRFEAEVDGGRRVALFNVNDPTQGQAWQDGRPLEGEALTDALRSANSAYINDSYWLLMPYKWSDPGVNAAFIGEETDDQGRTWEVVELTFDGVGLTPQNKYRAFVNPETGLMEQWYHYRDAADSVPSTVTGWTEWRQVGPIMLSPMRPTPEGNVRIRFENLEVSSEVPEGAFAPPTA